MSVQVLVSQCDCGSKGILAGGASAFGYRMVSHPTPEGNPCSLLCASRDLVPKAVTVSMTDLSEDRTVEPVTDPFEICHSEHRHNEGAGVCVNPKCNLTARQFRELFHQVRVLRKTIIPWLRGDDQIPLTTDVAAVLLKMLEYKS